MEDNKEGLGIQCLNCKEKIFSNYRHDFKYCKCGDCFVDGGFDYLRCGFKDKDKVRTIPRDKQAEGK